MPVILLRNIPDFPDFLVLYYPIFVALGNLVPLSFQKKKQCVQQIILNPLPSIFRGQPGLDMIQYLFADSKRNTRESEQGTGTQKNPDSQLESG